MPSHQKPVNLALQGGGAHGAFGWGVLDALLEDGRLRFDGLSGTSAGSMNAVVMIDGLLEGGPRHGAERAREKLHDFWFGVSRAGSPFSTLGQQAADWFTGNHHGGWPMQDWMRMWAGWWSASAQGATFNPLRDLLESQVDFERVRACPHTKLFIAATDVNSGNVRVFHTEDITVDALLASACLPYLYPAVEIGGRHYWDGGYMGNPVLFPFFYETDTRDILVVHINPIARPDVPTQPQEVMERLNEITFNASLLREMRAIAFVQKLLREGWLKPEYEDRLKYILLHSIRADDALADLSSSTKLVTDWNFLLMLRERGRTAARAWLEQHFDAVGKRGTVDIHREFLSDMPL
ncbi:NTE family protein [Cupriavidus gilardii J11]|uniref:NTE family protein n=1 Tax=Cupriavidus gilardii J11 TaxID=936133 RepID=A0A562BLH2_9BURK|nr:patatin-like phospholipase family protein [Cupriavidus gilardii]TWG85769.1 NTE family protein [Cupriavidus gilardii J11]